LPLADNYGFKSLAFIVNPFDWGTDNWREINLTKHVDLNINILSEIVERGKELGVTVGFVKISNKFSSSKSNNNNKIKSLCSWPYSKLLITSDMRIVPCCHISNPDVIEIGNLRNSESVTKEWFSDSYQSFRSAHSTGEIPDPCKSCYK